MPERPVSNSLQRAASRRTAASVAVLLLALTVTARAAFAQGRIDGVVRDTAGTGVVGAQIRVAGSTVRAESDETGSFSLLSVPAGRAELQVRRLGFAPRTESVDVGNGTTSRVTIVVHEVAREIAPVVVRAQRTHQYTGYLAGFYERRDRGFGHFITEDAIARRNPRRLTDMLRTVPGMTIYPDGMGGSRVRIRGNSCWPAVWLDGMPAVAAEFDVDGIDPGDVAGMEIYSGAAAVPVEYVVPFGPTACGTILIWTKHPEPRRAKDQVTARQLDSLISSLQVYTADNVDTQARADTAALPTPLYPDSLYRARVPGRVVSEFIVDTTGRARPGRIGIVSSTDPLFSDAVRRAIAAARFVPAQRGGRPVPQIVRQSFDFVIPAGLKPNER